MNKNSLLAVLPLFVIFMALLAAFPSGCEESSPVHYVRLMRAAATGPAMVPTGGWAIGAPRIPHPTIVQGVYRPDERLYAGLVLRKTIRGNVTFSRYAFYSRESGEETDVATADLGPFEPGQVTLVGVPYPWPVPGVPGTYEFRIYLGERMVASAVFEVRE